MGSYDEEMASDRAGKELDQELANAQPSTYNRFKVNVSHIAYKCTFGVCGKQKPSAEGECTFSGGGNQ